MFKRFIKDMLTYMPSMFLPTLTGLITVPLLTRLFAPAEYGNWALATGVSDFLFAFTCSGLGSAAFRFFPVYKAKSGLSTFFSNLIGMISLTVGIVSAISIISLLIFREFLPKVLYPLMFISVLVFMVQSFFTIFLQIVRVQEKSRLYTWLNLSNNYGSLILGLALVLVFGMRIEGLLLGTLGVVLLGIPIVFRITMKGVKIGIKFLASADILVLWQYAWPLAVGNMAMWGLRLSDRFIISFFRSETEVGLYSAVYNLSDKTIAMLVTLFLLSMGPMVINTWETSGRKETEGTLAMITRLFLIICLPVTVGLAILAMPFVNILTGDAYHEGYRIVGYVAFSTFAYGLSMIAGWGLLLNKKTRQYAVNQILAALINLGLNILLVPRYGFIAAGITTLIGYTLLFLLQIYSSRTYLSWLVNKKTLLNVFVAVILMGGAVYAVNSIGTYHAGIPNLFHLCSSIIAGMVVYFIFLWLLGEISESEKTWIRQFYREIGRRTP